MIRPGSATASRLANGPGRASVSLLHEYDSAIARAQEPAARLWRERMGWPRRAATMGLGGGVQRILPHADGLYTPCDDGSVAAIIIPVWSGAAPGSPDDLVDLAAWVPTSGNIYTRRGLPDVLGEWSISLAEPCMGVARPLAVFADPGAWARTATWDDQGGHGIVFIDWSRARSILGHLIGVVDFVCDSIITGQRLRAALAPPPTRKARILVHQDAQRGAA